MALRGDSYGTVAEVQAYTQYLMGWQSAFNSTTQPTLTQVEKFVDRASAAVNVALHTAGLAAPITNSTAKLLCDDWVTARASEYVELTRRGVGYSEAEGSRTVTLRGLYKDARDFVADARPGFVGLGVTETQRLSDGLQFTGLDAQADRDDRSDTGLVQPKFERGLFDADT